MRPIASRLVALIAALWSCCGPLSQPVEAQDEMESPVGALDALNAWRGDLAEAATLAPGGVVVTSSQAAILHACASGLPQIVGDEAASHYIVTTGGHFEQDTAWVMLSQYKLLENNPNFSHSDLRRYSGPRALFCAVSEAGPQYAIPREEGRLEWLEGSN